MVVVKMLLMVEVLILFSIFLLRCDAAAFNPLLNYSPESTKMTQTIMTLLMEIRRQFLTGYCSVLLLAVIVVVVVLATVAFVVGGGGGGGGPFCLLPGGRYQIKRDYCI